MSTSLQPRMGSDEFLVWAQAQPEGRHELIGGVVVAMAPERAAHAETKLLVAIALRDAIRAAGLPCRAYVDGLAVRISDDTTYQPDVLVHCGERLPPDTVVAPAPVIVVEVASPSTERFDAVQKLQDYAAVPSIHHYLIIDVQRRKVIHHRRHTDGSLATRISGAGAIELEPPGLTVRVEDLFET